MDDGGFVTGAIVPNNNKATYELIITRFNATLQVLWSKAIASRGSDSFLYDNIGYGFNDFHFNMIKTDDNGILAVFTDVGSFKNCIVTKLDQNGNPQWSDKIFATFANAYVEGIGCSIVKNDGFIITGSYDSAVLVNPSNYDYQVFSAARFMAWIDNKGTLKWMNIWQNGYGYYNSPKVLVFSDKSLLSTNGSELIKMDSMGKIIWDLTSYYNLYIGVINAMILDDHENIYACSYGARSNGNGYDYAPVLMKLDKNGAIKWTYYYGDSVGGNDSYADVEFTANKHIVILDQYYINNSGSSTVTNSLYSDSIRLIEADSNGLFLKREILPVRTSYYGYYGNGGYGYGYGGYGNGNNGNSMSMASDSGMLISGTSGSGNTTVFKTDSSLTYACAERSIGCNRFGYRPINYPETLTARGGFAFKDTTISISPYSTSSGSIVCTNILIPQVNIGRDTILCIEQSYTLYKGAQNAGAKTLWSTGDTTDSIVIKKSGRYWLRLTHGPYISTDTVTIIFKSLIKTGLPKTESICPYDSVLLSIKDTISSYYWITPKMVTVQGRSVMAKDSGYYYLMIKGTQNCASIDTVHVTYYLLPMASAGPDTILCYNETYTMQGAGGITYTWHPATYLSSSTDPKAIAKLPNTEQYMLVVRNAHGCQDSSPVLLKVRPPLLVKALVNNATVCYGQTIVLSTKASGGDSLHYQFNWNPDNVSGDSIIEKAYQSGWHQITLSDNCSAENATDSVYVTVIPQAIAAFTYGSATKIKANHNVNFQNQSTNASSYLWTFGTKDSSKAISPVYIYTDTGDYQVTLIAYGINNCPNDTAYGFIKIITDRITIYIPNAFSPNGDGVNDVFDITGVGIKSYSYNIYNRWGENIYSAQIPLPPFQGGIASNPHGWDGNFKGAPVSDGVYIYMFDITDVFGEHHYINGNVTLMR